MTHTIRGLMALLLGAGLLILGHGLLTTLLSVRGEIAGFGATLIGGVGTAYYAGFFGGCMFLPPLMRRIGHIRMFSAAGALVAAASLIQGMLLDPGVWIAVRFVTGIAMATLFMAVDSWLQGRATNETRGRVFSVYMVINLGANMAAQQILRIASPDGLELFAIAAVLICLGLLPVTLTRSQQPATPPVARLQLRKLISLSPMGTAGCFLAGLITSPFWVLGPVYAQRLGYDLVITTIFMSSVIAGGAVFQWPIGMISDRVDRRYVLTGVFASVALVSGAMATGYYLPVPVWLALAAGFGATAFCINSLSVSHVNDIMTNEDRIGVSAGLMLLFGAGAIVSPILAGFTMAWFGPGGMFGQIACVAVVGFGVSILRRRARPVVPGDSKEPFVAANTATTGALPLDPRIPADQAGFEVAEEDADNAKQ
jgi:MFS family permease